MNHNVILVIPTNPNNVIQEYQKVEQYLRFHVKCNSLNTFIDQYSRIYFTLCTSGDCIYCFPVEKYPVSYR